MSVTHEKLKPFVFHGAEFEPSLNGTQAKGFCPFCYHDNWKFYVNIDTQQWDCKHCGLSGNLNTFLQQTMDVYLEETTTDHYKALAADRYGIPWKAFKDYGCAIDEYTLSKPRWLIPVRNQRGTMVNIVVYQPGHPPMNTAGIGLRLLGIDELKGVGDIHVCEGVWDFLAWRDLIRRTHKKVNVVGVLGCQTFKAEWRQYFNTRRVSLLYDNQGVSTEGAEAAAFKLKGIAASVSIARWPVGTPDKFDVRDAVHAGEQTKDANWRETVYDAIMAMLDSPLQHRTPSELLEDTSGLPKRNNFRGIITDFRKHYHMDDNMRDGLAICFATVFSIQLPGDPIWLFLVGPPGSGKTLMLESFMQSPYCVYRSSITPRSLISGFRSEEGDPSLIPQLAGKVLVLKDYTEIMGMGRDDQEQMYSILRGAYDGHCEKTFGNGLTRRYDDCHFAMLAGVTDEIHTDNRAALGERFLKFQLVHGENYNPEEHIARAIQGMKDAAETQKFIRSVAASFSNRSIQQIAMPALDTTTLKRTIALAQIVAYLRAGVSRVGRDEIAYRPVPEVGTRLAKTLVKLGQTLSVVFGVQEVNQRCYDLMERVAFDTAIGWNLDVFRHIVKHHPQPVYMEPMSLTLRIPATTIKRRLDDMLALGVIERGRKTEGNSGPGQPAFGYVLTKPLAGLCQQAKLL